MFHENFQVNGIRGPSALLMLPYIDMTKMFPVDWMHSVHLGITKALMGFWFVAKHRREDYFIGDKVNVDYFHKPVY